VLVGTAPRGGEGMEGGTPEGNRIFGASYDPPDQPNGVLDANVPTII
jgi:hypothetical protein